MTHGRQVALHVDHGDTPMSPRALERIAGSRKPSAQVNPLDGELLGARLEVRWESSASDDGAASALNPHFAAHDRGRDTTNVAHEDLVAALAQIEKPTVMLPPGTLVLPLDISGMKYGRGRQNMRMSMNELAISNDQFQADRK